jgi:16S rRNA (cytidine1402-2'-O)-methyltransferase
MNLFVVATPIGNLGDMTFRAIETLKTVDIVAAEDTRTAQKLFTKFDIHTPLVAFHAHSLEKAVLKLVGELQSGKSLALISEAGTPGISDPGYNLISAAIAAGVKVIPIPGCCAMIAALSASGLPMDKFNYLGFLPMKKGRVKLMETLKAETKTVVFYESPHRIMKTLAQLAEILGDDREVVVGREITKMFEEFFRGNLAAAKEWIASKPIKGEFTVVLGGKK